MYICVAFHFLSHRDTHSSIIWFLYLTLTWSPSSDYDWQAWRCQGLTTNRKWLLLCRLIQFKMIRSPTFVCSFSQTYQYIRACASVWVWVWVYIHTNIYISMIFIAIKLDTWKTWHSFYISFGIPSFFSMYVYYYFVSTHIDVTA